MFCISSWPITLLFLYTWSYLTVKDPPIHHQPRNHTHVALCFNPGQTFTCFWLTCPRRLASRTLRHQPWWCGSCRPETGRLGRWPSAPPACGWRSATAWSSFVCGQETEVESVRTTCCCTMLLKITARHRYILQHSCKAVAIVYHHCDQVDLGHHHPCLHYWWYLWEIGFWRNVPGFRSLQAGENLQSDKIEKDTHTHHGDSETKWGRICEMDDEGK